MKELSIKQLKNLKDYKEGKKIQILTAKMIDNNWDWAWYDLDDVLDDIKEYRTFTKYEYRVFDVPLIRVKESKNK